MGKFLVVLFILIICAVAVFYIGWISFQIDDHEYGVIFSKTQGWDPDIISPGEFRWYWGRLLPTNVNLYKFDIQTERSHISISRQLPSAEHYSLYLEGNPDFSISADAIVEWELDPHTIPHLAAERNIRPENQETINNELSDKLSFWFEQLFESSLRSFSSDSIYDSAVQLENISSELQDKIPEIRILSVSVQNMKFPDLDLYESGRLLYRELVESRREAIQQANAAVLFEELIMERQLEALRVYGQIITEFPLLLDYFQLSAETDTDPLRLSRMGALLSPSGQ
ncbi:hypothetical protein [Spirochaeta dissipatitropha]